MRGRRKGKEDEGLGLGKGEERGLIWDAYVT